MHFLMGLNDSFSHIRGQILLIDPIPSVEKVFSLLIQDEKQRSIGQGSNNGPFVESTVLAAKGTSIGSKNKKDKGKERPVCSHYGLQGILWRSVTNSMDILLVTKPNAKLLWLIKCLLVSRS